MDRNDYLSDIVVRKRAEIARRKRKPKPPRPQGDASRGQRAIAALTRPRGADPRVMAEVKFKSPSAGEIRPWSPGEGVRVAQAYVRGGASVVSVLADGPGFSGSPLLVRRVAEAVDVPVLYKGFVLDPLQVDLAYHVGACLVLLLVRALERAELEALIAQVQAAGMEPVVEAADEAELDTAVETDARIIGVNARDLRTFTVDTDAATRQVARIPSDRIAVFMSGVRGPSDFERVAATRADAVLIGESLMRAQDPARQLRALVAPGS